MGSSFVHRSAIARSHAIVLSALVLGSCMRAGPAPRGPETGREPALGGREPRVRVGVIVDSTRAQVSATSAYEVFVAGSEGALFRAPANEITTVSVGQNGALSVTRANGDTAGPFNAPVVIRPSAAGTVLVAGKPYRGEALVRAGTNGRLSVINVLDLEAYLLGVVPEEIGRRPSTDIEAVKAQAIAARTYAIGNLNGRSAQGFDFYASDLDQVYRGYGAEDTVASRAVKETAGEIVTYQGQPILAYYHSTCGGRTSAIEDSWRSRAPQPYLKSVSDEIPGTDRSYCDLSNRYRWTVKWTGEQLRNILASTLKTSFGASVTKIEDVQIDGRTPSGRVDQLKIRADGRTFITRTDSLRWVLRPEAGRLLNSSLLFDLDVVHREGAVAELEVHGGGWGHGIGMCQFGAIGRARAGQSYRTILATYYAGTQVTRLY